MQLQGLEGLRGRTTLEVNSQPCDEAFNLNKKTQRMSSDRRNRSTKVLKHILSRYSLWSRKTYLATRRAAPPSKQNNLVDREIFARHYPAWPLLLQSTLVRQLASSKYRCFLEVVITYESPGYHPKEGLYGWEEDERL